MLGFSTKQTDRNLIHWLQGFFECCGVFDYEDWLPLTAKNSLVEYNLLSKETKQWAHCTKNGCYLPHSCCKSSQLSCSPLILSKNCTKNIEIGVQKANDWFHPNGCVDEVKKKLVTFLPVFFSILHLIIHCITLTYSQIACTSYYTVMRCKVQDDAILPAWILPFPRPYPRALIKVCCLYMN
ncbi:unnamed protein product [Thelazia callipaeda]|uniref:Tetraspanin n=1 Tax=Thelazia callipaeda TaxID=103827 RepID=A0A0N5CKS2_THECL|nr:unnamed protein product [Thelazia callipaeda]